MMKHISILTALTMIAFATACGSETGTDEGGVSEVAVEAPAEDQPTAEPPTEVPPTPEPPTEIPPTDVPQTGTRQNPMTLEETSGFVLKNGGIVAFTINEVLLGPEATARLKQVNQFNDDPQPGNIHVLVSATAAIDEAATESMTFDRSFFELVVDGRPVAAAGGMVMPQPEFEGEILPPGELGGWVFFEIPDGESIQLVALRQVDGGKWWTIR